jgi:pyruvate formate lyase activating enzyme
MAQEIRTLHWNKLSDKKVQCQLCPHYCTLIPNEIGKCGVRINLNGDLQSNVLDKCISTNIDPIEKKPLYHFLPNSKAYSLATMGCNFSCDWCQNWQIAQLPSLNGNVFGNAIAPETHIQQAKQTDCKSIAYTYTEPTIFFEYAFQIMQLAQQNNLFNLFITNGFISPSALADLQPFLSAANIDLKSFSDQTYRKHVNGRLQPVLDTIKMMYQAGIWIELTTLIIPTINDTELELTEIASFIMNELGPDVPWHISRFIPLHRLKHLSPTPLSTLKLAKKIAESIGLHYVYIGNVFTESTHTYCPNCNPVKNNKCPHCQTNIAGVWE